MRLFSALLLLSMTVPAAMQQSAPAKPIEIKVVVIALFEQGAGAVDAAVGGRPGEVYDRRAEQVRHLRHGGHGHPAVAELAGAEEGIILRSEPLADELPDQFSCDTEDDEGRHLAGSFPYGLVLVGLQQTQRGECTLVCERFECDAEAGAFL